MNLRTDTADEAISINGYHAKGYRWLFDPLDAVYLYATFAREPSSLLRALVFRGDGVAYCDEECEARFEELLDDLGIKWITVSKWEEIRRSP